MFIFIYVMGTLPVDYKLGNYFVLSERLLTKFGTTSSNSSFPLNTFLRISIRMGIIFDNPRNIYQTQTFNGRLIVH